MRIFFLNRFYWPDEPATAQLLADLATALAALGHSVTVIAARSARHDGLRSETHDGVVIERIRTTTWGRTHLAARIADFATYAIGALWRLLRLARRGDVVIALTDPPLIGAVAWPIAKLRRAKIIHWTQDIYPEIAADIYGHQWLRALCPFRDCAWRRADACIVPGKDLAGVLVCAGVRARTLLVSPNWAPVGTAPATPTELASLRNEWGLGGKFVMAYSGNLGRIHDLHPLLEVAGAMRGDPNFIFLIIGDGAQRASLVSRAQSEGLANVQFHPPQPRTRLAVTLSLADAHFVTLRAGAERFVFPSKLAGIAAVGRPAIFIGSRDCELARLIKTHNLGAAFSRDEIEAIVTTLRRWRNDPDHYATVVSSALAFSPDAFARAVSMWDKLVSTGSAVPIAST